MSSCYTVTFSRLGTRVRNKFQQQVSIKKNNVHTPQGNLDHDKSLAAVNFVKQAQEI